MNDFINKINQRISVRSFDDKKKLTEEEKEILINAVNNSPTSSNNQYFGCVFIEDKKIIENLSSKGKFQQHLSQSAIFAIFFIENHRLKKILETSKQEINASHLQLLTLGTVDATIAATMLQDAALSLGLGTCWIGAIRQYPEIIISELKLPKNNIPIVGMAIGFPNLKEEIKPKINKVYWNTYKSNQAIEELNNYNKIMLDYYHKRSNNSSEKNYYQRVVDTYKNGTWDKEWCDLIYNAYPRLKK